MELFCSDLDYTLLGDDDAALRFREFWCRDPGAHRPLLVYSSGRTIEFMTEPVMEGLLPEPDYYVAEVGTRIYDVKAGRLLSDYVEWVGEGWAPAAAQRVGDATPDAKPQPEWCQSELKRSWYWYGATAQQLDELQNRLHAAGVAGKVIYSSRRDLDIIPERADKGGALRWILDRTKLCSSEAVVAGDSGNDSAMFTIEGIAGILVGNARSELRSLVSRLPRVYQSKQPGADGVIEGLRLLRAAGCF